MSARRLVSVLSVCLFASAGWVAAAPTPKKGPVAPAKDPSALPPPGPGSGSGSGSAEPAPPPDEPPPADMNGTGEDPGAPKAIGQPDPAIPIIPIKAPRAGYPIAEALRPITLPQNMTEIAIGPHAEFAAAPANATGQNGFKAADALRARFGITRQIQLGLTYVFGGFFHSDAANNTGPIAFHPGKAVGLDVTVLLQNWIAVRLGVPIYINPVAVSLALGVPLKFVFGDKFALGGLDDLLNIKIHKFAPSFYQEADNAAAASNLMSNTEESNGTLRFSFYGIYQTAPNTALIGRFGFNTDLGGGGGSAPGTNTTGGTTTFLRAEIDFTPRRYLDVGVSLGFDDLGHVGSFGPAGYLAIRI